MILEPEGEKPMLGAKEKRIVIPAIHKTVTKSEKISEGKVAWQKILCETDTTKSVVQRLKVALNKNGFNPGHVDGVVGSETMGAVNVFQKSKQQASDQFTLEILKPLNVSL